MRSALNAASALLVERLSEIASLLAFCGSAWVFQRPDPAMICATANRKQGSGGRGGMAIALEENAAKAHAIADAFDTGTVERKRILENLNRLNAKYQDVLADQNLSRGERRAALQGIHGKIAQSANALTAALPVALLRSFAQELQGGATISGNPTGSQRLSAYLRDHGDTLAGLMPNCPRTI